MRLMGRRNFGVFGFFIFVVDKTIKIYLIVKRKIQCEGSQLQNAYCNFLRGSLKCIDFVTGSFQCALFFICKFLLIKFIGGTKTLK